MIFAVSRTCPRSTCFALALAMFVPVARAQQCDPVLGAQAPLAAGIQLPISLDKSLIAGKTKAGTTFVGRTTQKVPLSAGVSMKGGAEVMGRVVTSERGRLVLQFTAVKYEGKTTPLAAEVVAMASSPEVTSTQEPVGQSSGRGNDSQADWTTFQVGGDAVIRAQWAGPVVDHKTETRVGKADFNGVYTLAMPAGVTGCPEFPRAVGVFSVAAAGAYGFPEDVKVAAAGGMTTVTGGAKVELNAGSHLLLRTVVK